MNNNGTRDSQTELFNRLTLAFLMLAPAVLWFVASIYRWDIYLKIGGAPTVLKHVPLVTVCQWAALIWVGFNPSYWKKPLSSDVWHILRACFIGIFLIVAGIFMWDRLVTVSRSTLIVYPVIFGISLTLPKLLQLFNTSNGAENLPIFKAAYNPPSVVLPAEKTEKIGIGEVKPVSVIIVNFNAGRILSDTVESVLSSSFPVQVIVSDNGSIDGSIEFLRQKFAGENRLVIIENGTNLGFAKGCNIGLPYATGEYILYLNPDCFVERDTIERMGQIMREYPEAGMAGCLIKGLDGIEQGGCRRSVPTPWRTFVRIFQLSKLLPNHPRFRSFVMTHSPLPDKPVYIEAISGAFMFLRRKALDEIGPLDESYFLHCEDLDWCMRFNQSNWKILFVPNVAVTHALGICSVGRPIRVLWHKHTGMIKFYRKFFRHQYRGSFMWLVISAVWIRFALLSAVLFVRPGMGLDDDGLG
ncbi:MAG: glycosyltransferase family 2 protein [Thermodesulfobacteriota bacterium]|nr:glycosyltransferase family 2 protein [Thermodesulfobacteriota bacterium]